MALDLPGNKAYVTDVEKGKLIELDLNSAPAAEKRTWNVPRAAGVALTGGKAYVGQYDLGGLYEVDLTADAGTPKGTPKAVATNLGNSVRVALDGTVNAYVADSAGASCMRSPWPTARPGAFSAWRPRVSARSAASDSTASRA
ncbi:hypothetical protein [Streptomyces sp. S186]|uniref:hypothetical protein n=1 Tax=Streptomyces sp. S186 TaxID=3434395 RepID=UPI003F673731